MRFYLLDAIGAARPRYSFDATTGTDWRGAISALPPVCGTFWIAADLPSERHGRPWLLARRGCEYYGYVTTPTGLRGAHAAAAIWPAVVAAARDTDRFVASICGLSRFAEQTVSRPGPLRIVE